MLFSLEGTCWAGVQRAGTISLLRSWCGVCTSSNIAGANGRDWIFTCRSLELEAQSFPGWNALGCCVIGHVDEPNREREGGDEEPEFVVRWRRQGNNGSRTRKKIMSIQCSQALLISRPTVLIARSSGVYWALLFLLGGQFKPFAVPLQQISAQKTLSRPKDKGMDRR